MKTKVIVKVNDWSKVYLLEQYGTITYRDDFSNQVFIEVNESLIGLIQNLSFVSKVSVSRTGELLLV